MTELQCSYCKRIFAQPQNLKRHVLLRCKEKIKYEHTELINTSEQQLQAQHERHERQLQTQRDQYEQQLRDLKNQYETQLEKQQRQIEKLEQQIFEIAKNAKPNISTTNYNSSTNHTKIDIAMQLAPYDLTSERATEILNHAITHADWDAGQEAYMLKVMETTLIDPITGKPKLICTDKNRLNCKLLDPVSKEVAVDHGFLRTHQILKEPVLKRTRDLYFQVKQERGHADGEKHDVIHNTFVHADRMGRQFLKLVSKMDETNTE